MKRILILTILLMSSLAWAGSTTVVVGQGGAGGGGAACSGTYGNDSTTDAGYHGGIGNYTYLIPVTVDCTGTPATINFRTKYGTVNVKFLIYADSAGSPSGTPLYVGDPVAISNPSSVITITDSGCDYEVSSGTYWVGVISDTSFRVYYEVNTGGTYHGYASSYESPGELGEPVVDKDYDAEIWMTF